jgi:hypothetical protein
MLEDDPGWEVFMNLMKALYRNHPIRVSVAGSQESISHITPETLYACHKAFYHPSNMVLCVAGNLDARRVVDIAREILPQSGQGEIERDYGEKEPQTVAQAVITGDCGSRRFFSWAARRRAGARRSGAEANLLEICPQGAAGTSSPLYRGFMPWACEHSFSYGYED